MFLGGDEFPGRGPGDPFGAWFEGRVRTLAGRAPVEIPREIVPSDFREAAVLIPFWHEGDSTRLLLTLRQGHLPSHQGQIAFPGGAKEASDADLCETAVREAEEETGLPRDIVDVVAALDEVWSIGRFIVRPWVAWLREPPVLAPNEGEIARIIVADVERLMDPAIHQSSEWTRGPGRYRVHYFDYSGDVIWGMTGGVLHALLEHVRGRAAGLEAGSAEALLTWLETERT